MINTYEYIPPYDRKIAYKECSQAVLAMQNKFPKDDMLVVGDSIASFVSWDVDEDVGVLAPITRVNSGESQEFMSFIVEAGLIQKDQIRNSHGAQLDLCLTSNEETVEVVTCPPEECWDVFNRHQEPF